MKRVIKRYIAFVLVLVMVSANLPLSVLALTAGDADSFGVSNPTVYVDGISDKTVEIAFFGTENDSYELAEGVFSAYDNSGKIVINSITAAYTCDGQNNYAEASPEFGGYFSFTVSPSTLSFDKEVPIVTASYTVPKDTTPGSYTVSITNVNAKSGSGESIAGETYTATITVEEHKAPSANYEIYYTLDKADGTDGDHYHEYGVSDTVVATVKLKNNTATALTLQAYDIYLDYHTGLKYASHNMTGAVALADGSSTNAAAGAAVTHIEAVSDTYKNSAADKTLPANGELELGTISFTIDSNNADVKYGTPLNIGFNLAAEATNSANATGITNFSVGSTTGDKKSYYPMLTGDVLGAEVVNTYTVTFDANAGGDSVTGMPENNVETKQYNVAMDLPTLSRENYTFKGWALSFSATEADYQAGTDTYPASKNEENVTLYAVWASKTATVKFINYDGTELQSTVYDLGAIPSYSGETPTKPATAQYTYSFAGWSPEISEVTEDVTYTATYTETVNEYTIKFVNEDGTELQSGKVAYGKTPAYTGATPTKAATAEYTYTFAGWTPEITSVTGVATYTATYTATPVEYTVTWKSDANTVISSEKVAFGADFPNAPTNPTKNGYTFKAWDAEAPETMPANDVTITATWELVEYTIEFIVSGGTMNNNASTTQTYNIEEIITLPTASRDGYNFGGWDVTSNGGNWNADNYSGTVEAGQYGPVTLTAVWTNKPISVGATATQGTVSVSNNAGGGNTANEGDTVTITLAPKTGYEYAEETLTLSYQNDEGETKTVTATKGNDGKYTFTVPEDVKDLEGIDEITTNITFTAINYEIKYELNGGTNAEANPETYTIVSDTISLGDPSKVGYKFEGWYTDKDFTISGNTIVSGSTENKTFYAKWSVIEYTIFYKETDGGEIGTDTYTTEAAKTLKNDASKPGYTFAGWYSNDQLTGNAVTEIEAGSTEDKTFYAKWTPNTDTAYTVKHYKQDMDLTNYTLEETENLTGTTGASITPPVKSYEGFTAPATQTVTIAADGSTLVEYKYDRTIYGITATANNSSYGTVTAPKSAAYGTTVTLSNTPATGYEFDSYSGTYKVTVDGQEVEQPLNIAENGTFTMPAANVEVVATFEATQYEITFDLNGGQAYTGTTTVTNNKLSYTIESTAALPGASRSLYTFTGWKVTTKDGNWTDTSLIDAGTPLNRNFGNVTLTAQWTFMDHEIQDYKYAYNTDAATDGYMMLLVKDSFGNETGKTYTFDSKPMYHTTDSNYLLNTGDAGVFFTLIKEKYVTDGKLNADGEAKLSTATSGRTTLPSELAQKCDINGDGVVNIADANVVYQMTLSGGSYYSDGEMEGGQLDSKHRLMADLDTAIVEDENGISLHRGSIADVHVIVNHINGVVETTNP